MTLSWFLNLWILFGSVSSFCVWLHWYVFLLQIHVHRRQLYYVIMSSQTEEENQDLPLLSAKSDFHVSHYIIQLNCDTEKKSFSGCVYAFATLSSQRQDNSNSDEYSKRKHILDLVNPWTFFFFWLFCFVLFFCVLLVCKFLSAYW